MKLITIISSKSFLADNWFKNKKIIFSYFIACVAIQYVKNGEYFDPVDSILLSILERGFVVVVVVVLPPSLTQHSYLPLQ